MNLFQYSLCLAAIYYGGSSGWLLLGAAFVALALWTAPIWNDPWLSARRKLQIVSWSAPTEGSIYSRCEIDCERLLAWLERANARRSAGETKLTITHVIGKIAGLALTEAPGLNGRIVLGRFLPFATCDVSYLAVLEGGKNLAKVKVESVDRKSVAQIADALAAPVSRLRAGKDTEFQKSMNPLRALPSVVLEPLVFVIGFLSGALGVRSKALGINEAHPFGAVLITNVGGMGIREAYAPFSPYARTSLVALIGAIHDAARVHEGKVCVRKVMNVCITMDHRFLDGAQAATMSNCLQRVAAEPEKYLD